MKAIKIIFAICVIVLIYANAVVPVKRPKPDNFTHSHGRLKIVFGGRQGTIDH